MQTQTKILTWVGWILAGLIGLFMAFGATMTFFKPPDLAEQLAKFGYPEELMVFLAATEIACVVLYLIPRTAVLGAVLLTGYLGGAIATHVRIHDNFLFPLIFGVLVWLALYLRDPRVRALLPLRQPLSPTESQEK